MEKGGLVIITGGTGYLGVALGQELERRGFSVAALSRSSQDYPCDVTELGSLSRAVQKALRADTPLVGAIHAASPPLERVAETEASARSQQEHMAVALKGAQNLYTAILPYMSAEGVFIGITSDAAKGDAHKLGGYPNAKRAMEEYMEGLDAPFRVRLFSLGFLPGGLNSDLPERVRDFLATRSESVESVVTRIADALS